MANDLEWIPRGVRDKLDRVGIKLHLKEWTRMTLAERQRLVDLPCTTDSDVSAYRAEVERLVVHYTGASAQRIAPSQA